MGLVGLFVRRTNKHVMLVFEKRLRLVFGETGRVRVLKVVSGCTVNGYKK